MFLALRPDLAGQCRRRRSDCHAEWMVPLPSGRGTALPCRYDRAPVPNFLRREASWTDTVPRATSCSVKDCWARVSAAGRRRSPSPPRRHRFAFADGAERHPTPTRGTQSAKARPGDGVRRGGSVAGTCRLHVPRPVRRPRPDLRQDERHARRAHLAGGPGAGALAEPRPRLALRRGPDRSGLGQVLRGRRHPPEDGQDGGGRRHSREAGLRPSSRRGIDGRGEAESDHPGSAKRREPRGRPDAPGVHPLPQPGGRHAPRPCASLAALPKGQGEGHQALPVDAAHRLPTSHLRSGRRQRGVHERTEGLRGRGSDDGCPDDAHRVLGGGLPARALDDPQRLQLEPRLRRRQRHPRPALRVLGGQRNLQRRTNAPEQLDGGLPASLRLHGGRPGRPRRSGGQVQPGAAHRHVDREPARRTSRASPPTRPISPSATWPEQGW